MKLDSPLNLKIFIIFLFCINSGYQANAQESSTDTATYFRYFKLETGQLTSDQISKLEASFNNHKSIKLKSSCLDGKSMLLAVDASYPKRIEDVEAEIISITTNRLSKGDIRSVVSVALPDISNFCN